MTNHMMLEDITSAIDFCCSCGHYHNSAWHRDNTKNRHCTIDGCRCMKKDFVGRKINGQFA